MRLNVYLIEDDLGDQKLIKLALNSVSNDLHLFAFRGADEAVSYIKSAASKSEKDIIPDIVLLDLNLPGTSGLEFLKEIKSEEPFLKLPVIVFTTSDAEIDIDECYKNYVNGYFKKPSDILNLKKVIKAIIEYWYLSERCKII